MSKQGALTPPGYRRRIVDERIDKLLKSFGGLEITGAKWCGKTWTALAHAKSYDSLMEANALDAARTDPNLVLMGDEPHLVDEWQEVPAIWDAARNHIDRNANRKGELILTGSARPKDEGKIRHSGTGRIARLRMRPMAPEYRNRIPRPSREALCRGETTGMGACASVEKACEDQAQEIFRRSIHSRVAHWRLAPNAHPRHADAREPIRNSRHTRYPYLFIRHAWSRKQDWLLPR